MRFGWSEPLCCWGAEGLFLLASAVAGHELCDWLAAIRPPDCSDRVSLAFVCMVLFSGFVLQLFALA